MSIYFQPHEILVLVSAVSIHLDLPFPLLLIVSCIIKFPSRSIFFGMQVLIILDLLVTNSLRFCLSENVYLIFIFEECFHWV